MDIHLRVYTVMGRAYWAASGRLDQGDDTTSLTGGEFTLDGGEDPVRVLEMAAAECVRVLGR